MDSLPESWNRLTTLEGPNSHTVTSALEIPSVTVFPKTGAAVRAVPLDPSLEEQAFPFGLWKQKQIISKPGDTFWLGARGTVRELEDDTSTPPDIEMKCIDRNSNSENTVVVTITWDQSWKDVLDQLRNAFGRACTFTSELGLVVNCEVTFDKFCSEIEENGVVQVYGANKQKFLCTVYINDLIHSPSNFILDRIPNQRVTKIVSEDQSESIEQNEILLDTILNGEPQSSAKSRSYAFWKRWDDTPYPLEYTMAFGGFGFAATCVAIVAGYWINWNSLAAISLALSWNTFLMSLFVTAVEDGIPSLGRLGVGLCGFFCSIIVIACFAISQEFIALVAAFLWMLASFWFIESTVKARGWGSWYTGAYQCLSWFMGGCPLQGFRKPEPIEEVIILGTPPKPNMMNRMKTLKERYPGCSWELPAPKQRVMHVGQCLETLSERNNPMGPYKDGIIYKSLARQLRKWLLRNGQELLQIGKGQEEQKMKLFAKLGMGTIEKLTIANDRPYVIVVWDNNKDKNSPHYYGEDNVYELLLVKEKEGNIGEYHDGEKIHSGGSLFTSTSTFLAYFLPRFCSYFWYWAAFWSYMLLLYGLEYSVTSSAIKNAIGSTMYQMKGSLYNTQPGGGSTTSLHIYCKGFTVGIPSPRPTVILESMEGIGSSVSMARLQDAIAQRGVCCTYDRLGLGFSSALEDSTIWNDRSPSTIARQLYYALVFGVDRVNSRKAGWTRTVQTAGNSTAQEFVPIQPPFLLLGHGAGSLYMRQFAHDYPNVTAGLILVNPLPAVNSGLPSATQLLLNPFLMTLCTRVLQPTGIIRAFLPTTVTGLFNDKTQFLLSNGGMFDDFDVMIWQMFERQWCPSVLAEWNSLYVNYPRGIDVVAASDRKGYSVPTALWVGNTNTLSGVSSDDPVYQYNASSPLARSRSSENRRGCQGCVSYFDICNEMLQYFPNSWQNPFTETSAIMTGDPSTCQIYGCTQYAPLENPVEVQQSVLDLWYMLGFSDPYASNVWAFVLEGVPENFDAIKFGNDLAVVLRHVASGQIQVQSSASGLSRKLSRSFPTGKSDVGSSMARDQTYSGPVQSYAFAKRPKQQRSAVGSQQAASIQYTGYSGSAVFGSADYVPMVNEGTFVVNVVFYGHTPRSTEWAAENLRGTEDTTKDPTAIERRTTFLLEWRLLSMREQTCSRPNTAAGFNCTAFNSSQMSLFDPTYTSPIYVCPQNAYANGLDCTVCPPGQTSRAGAVSVNDCFACPSYHYLSCSGVGCNSCPVGSGFVTFSDAGSLQLSDCVALPLYTAVMKGPIGSGHVSQAVTQQAQAEQNHSAFDLGLFREILSNLTGLAHNQIQTFPPTDSEQYPESRCTELRGACTFSISFQIFPSSSAQLQQVESVLKGSECWQPKQVSCPLPDVNRMKRYLRTKLFQDFQIVQFFSQTLNGQDSKKCPNLWLQGDMSTALLPIFNTSFVYPQYACPNKFYANAVNQSCQPCPDMTTSNKGALHVADCTPYNSIILVGKDPSLSFESRTNYLFGGQKKAQPNAVDIYGELKTNASYIKTRGYSLQLHEFVNAYNPTTLQAAECQIGLNCFNSSLLRSELSSLLGSVTANEIRLISPECNGNPASTLAPDLCGPWPGLPPIAAQQQCVCADSQANISPQTDVCFWTAGPTYVGKWMGTWIDNSLETVTTATAADCAAYTLRKIFKSSQPDDSAAFLYDPSSRECIPRIVDSNLAGQDVCPSTSSICRNLASQDIIRSGMQMFWEDRSNISRCIVKLEVAEMCSYLNLPPGQYAEQRVFTPNSTGLPNALDTFYLILNIHTETSNDLAEAMSALQTPTSVTFRSFLKKYNIIQIMIANDKQPMLGIGREVNLQVSGNVNASIGPSLECTYTCNEMQPGYSKSGGGPCGCSRASTGNQFSLTEGPCLCEGKCLCSNAVDADMTSALPMIQNSGLTLHFTEAHQAENIAYMLVTRVDIGVCQMLAEWSAACDSNAASVVATELQLAFSDGSTRELTLNFSAEIQVIYFEPAVSHFITITNKGNASVGLFQFAVTGEAMTDLFQGPFTNVDLRMTGSQPRNSVPAGYDCPATTYSDKTVGMCVPCSYPAISSAGSISASNCTCPVCGDGRLHWQADEECDDGNTNSGDGCDSTCNIEYLQFCFGPRNNKTGVGYPLLSYAQKDQCLRLGSYWTPYGRAPWESRFGMASLIHQGAAWIIGGVSNKDARLLNDTWFEISNGDACAAVEPGDSCAKSGGSTQLSWGRAGSERFSARGFLGAVSFGGSLWIIGGAARQDPSIVPSCLQSQADFDCFLDSTLADVWQLVSGVQPQWLLVTQAGPWISRGMHATLVYNGSIWIIGGIHLKATSLGRQSTELNDVWSSPDGKKWKLATQEAEWSTRAGHTAVVGPGIGSGQQSTNVMYVMGGRGWYPNGSIQFLNDVWSSSDGVTWNLVTQAAQWGSRWMHGSAYFQGDLWVIGGCSGQYYCTNNYADVWVGNGLTFQRSTSSASWLGRSALATFVFDSTDPAVSKWSRSTGTNLWLMGGQNQNFNALNDTFNIFLF